MLRDPAEVLGHILDRRRKDDAQLRPTRVVGRLGDGRTQLQRLDGECVQTAPLCAVYTGQLVERPCRPAFSLQGASGLAMASASSRRDALFVESLDPASFELGQAYTVTVAGLGFLPAFAINFLEYDSSEVHPGITIVETRYVSATEAEVDIEVALDADLLYDADGNALALPISYDNVGSAL